jgi:hypothetical protein
MMVIVLPPATKEVARFVDLIGADATLKLLEARGGTRLYIADSKEGGLLAGIVGLDAAEAMRRHFGKGEIMLPIGRPWRILCYIAMGLSGPQAALKSGTSEKVVHSTLQRYGRPITLKRSA